MDINITKNGFEPNNVIAQPPELVVWHNTDNQAHTVSASDKHSFDSAEIAPGRRISLIFEKKVFLVISISTTLIFRERLVFPIFLPPNKFKNTSRQMFIVTWTG